MILQTDSIDLLFRNEMTRMHNIFGDCIDGISFKDMQFENFLAIDFAIRDEIFIGQEDE
jgi:hypothetical protein